MEAEALETPFSFLEPERTFSWFLTLEDFRGILTSFLVPIFLKIGEVFVFATVSALGLAVPNLGLRKTVPVAFVLAATALATRAWKSSAFLFDRNDGFTWVEVEVEEVVMVEEGPAKDGGGGSGRPEKFGFTWTEFWTFSSRRLVATSERCGWKLGLTCGAAGALFPANLGFTCTEDGGRRKLGFTWTRDTLHFNIPVAGLVEEQFQNSRSLYCQLRRLSDRLCVINIVFMLPAPPCTQLTYRNGKKQPYD